MPLTEDGESKVESSPRNSDTQPHMIKGRCMKRKINKKRLIVNLGIVAVSTVIAVTLGEIGLRMAG